MIIISLSLGWDAPVKLFEFIKFDIWLKIFSSFEFYAAERFS